MPRIASPPKLYIEQPLQTRRYFTPILEIIQNILLKNADSNIIL